MKTKIESFFNFFKFFCAFIEYKSSSKLEKFLRAFWFSLSIMFILQSVYFICVTKYITVFDYVVEFAVYFYVQLGCFLILILIYKNRKKEHEILENLSEISELIDGYFEIKIKWGNFKRKSFWRIVGQVAFVLGTYTFRRFNQKEIYFYQNQLPYPELGIVLGRMFLFKYIFYIDLMHFLMKVKN